MNSNLLKSKRVAKGYNQGRMAALLGLTQATYCQKENGKKKLSMEQTQKIVSVLELTPDDVYKIFFASELP